MPTVRSNGSYGTKGVPTLYHASTAVCAIKVRLVFSEKGLKWTARDIDLRGGEQFSAPYLAINPNGVVPTLVHDGRIITESSIIMQYVDDLCPKPRLQSVDPFDRAQMRLWLKFVDEIVHPANITLVYAAVHRKMLMKKTPDQRDALFARVPDPRRRLQQKRAVELGFDSVEAKDSAVAFAECIRRMNGSLSQREWLAGDKWTLADAAATPYIDRLEKLGLAGLWAGVFPKVDDWLARIRSRPSYKDAVVRFAPAAAAPELTKDQVLSFVRMAASD